MEKKIYMMPLTEVTKVNLSTVVLAESGDPTPPVPPHPAPALPDGGSLF